MGATGSRYRQGIAGYLYPWIFGFMTDRGFAHTSTMRRLQYLGCYECLVKPANSYTVPPCNSCHVDGRKEQYYRQINTVVWSVFTIVVNS